MKTITVEKILENNPRWVYSEHRVKEIIGEGKTVAEYCDLPTSLFDSPADKFWVLADCDILSDRLLHEISFRAAESVLPRVESRFPGYGAPRIAIAMKKLWLVGLVTDAELYAARAAMMPRMMATVVTSARHAIMAAVRTDDSRAGAVDAAQDAMWWGWNYRTIAECTDIYEDLFVFLGNNAED